MNAYTGLANKRVSERDTESVGEEGESRKVFE
ncbi:hypothetical protein E2C01_096591 [Portunus trituberculatus]|uniref:Uncharacterized protein n=1 Tax=Portunus trituberculatus TaxID=210409 RepID=A0A5B7K7M4_PORTR|nr:hypothetical protein [Portunus trituberculatus]